MENGAAGRWLDVNSAAEELGVSTDAVRKRISRGSLRSERQDGSVRVWLDEGWTEAGHQAQVEAGALVEVLREQAEYLREQLDQERAARTEERRRHDTIIAQLTQANARLAARVPELEAPASPDARESSEGPDPAEKTPPPGPGGPRAATGAPEVGRERQPWWRRVLGR